VPDELNPTVPALEIGLGFKKHPTHKNIFLHGDKKLFSSYLQLLADQLYYYHNSSLPTHPLPKKNSSNTSPFPTL
jgi:hypothetical protein